MSNYSVRIWIAIYLFRNGNFGCLETGSEENYRCQKKKLTVEPEWARIIGHFILVLWELGNVRGDGIELGFEDGFVIFA